MNIIERAKNCEGCRRRRRFIKETLAGIGLAFLWPFKTKAQQVDCIFCPDGTSWCLMCDSRCTNCFFSNQGTTLTMCESCPCGSPGCQGSTMKCTGIGCPGGGCPPNRTCTGTDAKLYWHWEITTLDGNKIIISSNDPELDPMVWFNSHVKRSDGIRIPAKASHKL